MDKETAEFFIARLKTCKTGSTRAVNKALKEIAQRLAQHYAESRSPDVSQQSVHSNTFLAAAGFIAVEDMLK